MTKTEDAVNKIRQETFSFRPPELRQKYCYPGGGLKRL